MILGLDFGNTLLKFAVFKNSQIIHKGILSSFDKKEINELLSEFKIEKGILSSVIPVPKDYLDYLKNEINLQVLGRNTKTNLKLTEYQKDNLGLDRLALCEGALADDSNSYHFIICLGSCITYNLVSPDKEFIGGAISPGLNMKSKSMHDFTALLPHIPPQHWEGEMGQDTEGNLLSGLVYGSAYEVDGYIQWARKNYPNIKIWLTGGDSKFILDKLGSKDIFFEPNLLWKGLIQLIPSA